MKSKCVHTHNYIHMYEIVKEYIHYLKTKQEQKQGLPVCGCNSPDILCSPMNTCFKSLPLLAGLYY